MPGINFDPREREYFEYQRRLSELEYDNRISKKKVSFKLPPKFKCLTPGDPLEDPGAGERECPACHGRGYFYSLIEIGDGECCRCNGTGKIKRLS